MPKAWRRAETMPAALDLLIARSEALSEYADLADAIDELSDFAIRSGLTRELGIDVVQDVIAGAFAKAREVNLLDEARE
jgi:hypothetical protein